MDNYRATFISQYANSPIIGALMANMNAYLDPSANIDAFYDNVWNIDTAVGYGLQVWGRIVGVTNVVQIPEAVLPFGFLEALPFGAVGFGQGPFWDGVTPLTQPYDLNDNDYRVLILAKALANICDGSTPAINQILLNLFPGRGNCYVVNNGGMSMTYKFDFALTQVEYAIVTQSGVLPTPAGVFATVVTS